MSGSMHTLLASLVAVAMLSSGAMAQSISTVAPASGAVGTAVTITGAGFGTKKPVVYLTSAATGTKKYRLRVTSNSDTSIVATVSSGVAGAFDVNVQAGSASAMAPAAFALVPPTITPGQTATANVGTTLTLNGANFGTKKGKLVVGAKPAKVATWTDTAITFAVPTTIPNGAVVVDVYNSLGTDAISGYLTITGSSVPLAKNKVTGAIGRKKFKPRIYYIHYKDHGMGPTDWDLQMQTRGRHGVTLSIAVFDLTTIPAIYHGTEAQPATLTLAIAGGGSYVGEPGDFTITITHLESNKFAGVISGKVTGAGGATLQIQSVQFIFDTGL